MKYLFVCSAREFSGLEIATATLMKRLSDDGHPVRCLTHEWAHPDFLKRLRDDRVEHTQFDLGWIFIRRPRWTMLALRALPGARRHFRRVVREFRPDWIVHSSYQSILMLLGASGARAIYHVHDAHDRTIKHRVIWAIVRRVIEFAAVPSRFVRDRLMVLGVRREQIEIVRNGIRLPSDAGDRDQKLPRTIGVVAQLLPGKGHEVVVRAVAEMKERGIKARCLLFGAGSGAHVAALKELAKSLGVAELIEWRGFVNDHDAMYRDIDVLAIPSVRPEAFGLVATEAGARAIPVVAANIGALPEIIVDHVTGLLFEPSSASDLAEKLALVCGDADFAASLGRKAREHVIENFSDVAMARQFSEATERRARGVAVVTP